MKLPQDILNIAQVFIDNGLEIYLVGGAVRDVFLGGVTKDYDLVTNSQLDNTKAMLERAGFSVSDEQGKRFGVLRVYTKSNPEGYEIATFRKDISNGRDTKSDGDKVEMGTHITIEDDRSRRDFTINGMYYDIQTDEYLFTDHAIDDIENRVINCIGKAKDRFNEDRLRILRAVRFASRFNSRLSDDILEAIKEDCRLVTLTDHRQCVSYESIFKEILAGGKDGDFTDYLTILLELELREVFVMMNPERQPKVFKSLLNFIANLHIGVNTKQLEAYRLSCEFQSQIIFLIKGFDFELSDLIKMMNLRNRVGIDADVLKEWAGFINNPNFDALIDFNLSVKASDFTQTGRALGEAILRAEQELFIKHRDALQSND